ncbi:lysophospholipid acyltransferase family protein [Lutimaribacter marinistellae]|uniref:Lysophospholipid acyltransferase family protein n=1 Tax=Lutimaribacter marinistellae TaxID=1820329 RepID=A0ABV7TLI7_9RHOB
MSLRKKLADSEAVLNWAARRIAAYIRRVHRNTRWQRIGYEELDQLAEAGEPVIVVLWHQRLAQSPYFFPLDKGRICSITSAARAGSMVGRVQKLFGMDTIAMSSHKRHVALSREVLGKMKQGISIGIAADGPRGPERVSSTVPLVWARSSGKRVFGITYSVRHGREAATWDRLLLPRPWRNEGVFLCSEWTKPVPRKANEEEIEALRLDLEEHMNRITAEADRMVGREPWQPK